MRRQKINSILLLVVIVVSTSLIAGCGEEELNSSWNNNSIIVDGNQTDWQDKFYYLKDEHSAIGISNDEDFLYVCLATNDASKLFQIFLTGLTIWIEAESSGEKIGIQYPLKSDGIRGLLQRRDRNGDMQRPGIKGRLEEYKQTHNELRIVNEDNFPLTALYLENELGLEVEIGSQMGQLVYEMRIPYSTLIFPGHDLNLLPGENILLSFESGEFKRGDFGGRQRPSGLGMGGPGGGRRGPRSDGGMRQPLMEKIDFGVSVKLATE